MKRILLIAALLSSFNALAQVDSVNNRVDSVVNVDTLGLSSKDSLVIKKRFWRASGELMLVQVIPWAYNYFIRDADFAKISFESIGHNLKFSSWEWDDNNFKTNQIAHPYHGSLYFSSFRTNGYSFWQSVPAAFAGSYIWEVAGETHPPAPNDFINTSLGGISLGEMTFRLSNLVVNNRQTGFTRQIKEVFGFLISPMNGFNRILDGRWGRIMANPADRVPSIFISEFDFGARRTSEKVKDIIEKGNNQWFGRFELQYGDPYKDFQKPFENFYFGIEFGNDDSATINTVRVSGNLHGWTVKEKENAKHTAAITANYDYFHNSSFQYGGQSLNFHLRSDFKTGKKTRILTNVGGGGIVLGAVPDEYLYYGEGRNYDYGPGVGWEAGARFVSPKFWAMANYRGGWITTVNGNTSNFVLEGVSTEVRYFLFKSASLGLAAGYFNLKGWYEDYPDVHKRYPYLRLSLGRRFAL